MSKILNRVDIINLYFTILWECHQRQKLIAINRLLLCKSKLHKEKRILQMYLMQGIRLQEEEISLDYKANSLN